MIFRPLSRTLNRKKGILAACCGMTLGLATFEASANVLGDIHNSISSLWNQKSRKRGAAQAARSQVNSQTSQVAFLQQRVARAQQLLENANQNYGNYFRQMRQTEAKITSTDERLDAAQERYDDHKELFGRRLAAMQKHGQVSYLQIVLGSRSLAELTRRAAFFQAITQRDAQLQSDMQADKTELLQAKNALMAQWNERDRLQKEANQERERIAAGEDEQQKTLGQMDKARLSLLNYALEQEKSSAQIGGMIGSLQSRRSRLIAQYEAETARERRQLRARAVFQARERTRIVRSYGRSSARWARTWTRTRRTHYSRRNTRHFPHFAMPRNVSQGNYAPRVQISPRYAPRIELAPMPIEALRGVTPTSLGGSTGWGAPPH